MSASQARATFYPESTSPVCPVCLAADSLIWGFRTASMIFECKACGVVFFDRSKFELHSYQTYYEYTAGWEGSRVSWELKIRRRALRKQLSKIGSYVNGRKLLDVGAGPGYLCRIAADEGWQARGVEVSEKARAIGERFLGVTYSSLSEIEPESLDAVTCYHVLEHMIRPGDFIQELYSKLIPNGILAVHVPHREPLSFLIRNKLRAFDAETHEKLCALYVPEHISGFTKKSLAKALGLFRFQPLLLRTSSMWSTYYDPFFLRNYLREGDYIGILTHTLRCLVDNVGVSVGLGDWVIGHFRKT